MKNTSFENIDYLSDLLIRTAKLGAKLALQDVGVIKNTTTLAEIKKLHGVTAANEARMSTGIKWKPIGKGGRTSGVYCLRSEFEKFLFAREFDFNKK
ncbi:MAG TPA: hypothetical protein VFC67_02500 [Prolixibacteraceae bacterium]|nr:hypothetical protein [Prolixibacteraceae bacterium]